MMVIDVLAYWPRRWVPYLGDRFGRGERGAAPVEYALLLALLAVLCIVVLSALGADAS